MLLSCVRRHTINSIQKFIKDDSNILRRDKIVLKIRAGNGGKGLARFDGVGGRGGDVLIVGTKDMAFPDILEQFPAAEVIAANGIGALKTKLIGEDAVNTLVRVPAGVQVVNEETARVIVESVRMGEKRLVARGGLGGNRTNCFVAQKGDHVQISFHAKLTSNIALLGFPNAGKSTILKALVPSKYVKIGSYAFTTTHPQMAFRSETAGTDQDSFVFSIADLPGLIEGASVNRGKGYSFLKHLENADIIMLVVDCNGFRLKNDLHEPFRSALECVSLLNCEVEKYDKRLLLKPVVTVLNKTDTVSDEKVSDLEAILTSSDWISQISPALRPSKPFRIIKVVSCSAKFNRISNLLNCINDVSHLFTSLANNSS